MPAGIIIEERSESFVSFSVRKFKQACANYRANDEAMNIALYDLCKRHPTHQDKSGIHAKLWIIGRAYATGIERTIKSKGSQGDSMRQLAKLFWRERKRVDKVLLSLRGVNEPLTREKLAKILDAHGRLVRIVKPIVRKPLTPRSFVSKYLHFHNPAVPIFDSVAVRVAKKHYRCEKHKGSIKEPETADHKYADFLRRFWRLYLEAQDSNVKANVKLLDNYLLFLAKDES